MWQTNLLVASLVSLPGCTLFFDASLESLDPDAIGPSDVGSEDADGAGVDVEDSGEADADSGSAPDGNDAQGGDADVADGAGPDTSDADDVDDAADGAADTGEPDVEDPGLACERAGCESRGRACVIVGDVADCGACLATGEDTDGECPGRACEAARDCVSTLDPGEWSRCIGFENACDDTGEQVRERYLGDCQDLVCVWARRAERQPCLGEPTDGDPCATDDGIGLCVENRCAVGPDVPLGMTATDGASPDSVTVAWRPVEGATAYRVFRDGVQIAEVAEREWIDTTADAGGPPEAPTNVVASEDRPYDIQVTWNASIVEPGDTHTYTVQAVNADGISTPSAPDTGYRAAFPVEYYERSADDAPWEYAAEETWFGDPHGGPPVLNAGGTIASDGAFPDRVTLTLAGVTSVPAPTRRYRVRAVNAAGTSPESAEAVGRRGLGGLQYQWERSAGATPDGFTAIEFATRATEVDMSAPADGSVRYYRCRITSDPLDPVWTTPDSGFRAP